MHWAFNETVNAWRLTSVTVRLPRSKIQKLVSESVSRGPWYRAIFTNLERVLSEAWGTRKAEMKMCHLTLGAGGNKRLQGFSTSDSSRSVLKPSLWNTWCFPGPLFWALRRGIHSAANTQVISQWSHRRKWDRDDASGVPRSWATVPPSFFSKKRLAFSWLWLTGRGTTAVKIGNAAPSSPSAGISALHLCKKPTERGKDRRGRDQRTCPSRQSQLHSGTEWQATFKHGNVQPFTTYNRKG